MKLFENLISTQLSHVIDLLAGWVGAAFDAVSPWQQQWALDARASVAVIALSLLTLIIGYDTHRALLSGEEGVGGPVLFRRAVQAGVFIAASGWLLPELAVLARKLGPALASTSGGYADSLQAWMAEASIEYGGIMADSSLVIGGKILVFLVVIGVALWQAKLRAWQLAFLFILGPMAGLGAARTDDPMTQGIFGTWTKEVLSLLGADVLQQVGIAIMVTRVVNTNLATVIADNAGFWNTVLLGFAVVGLPNMIRGLLSGSPGSGGANLMGTVMAGQQVMMGLRRLVTRGV